MNVIINNKNYDDVSSVLINTYKNGCLKITSGHVSYCANGILDSININNECIKFNLNGVCLFSQNCLKFVSL